MKVAILDDYQNAALQLADRPGVRRHAEITVFNDHVADPSTVIQRLRPFDAVCVMRERTPLTREIIGRLRPRPSARLGRDKTCPIFRSRGRQGRAILLLPRKNRGERGWIV